MFMANLPFVPKYVCWAQVNPYILILTECLWVAVKFERYAFHVHVL